MTVTNVSLKESMINFRILLMKLIDINAYDADASYSRGNALEGLKKYHEAIRCYDNNIDHTPGYTKAW